MRIDDGRPITAQEDLIGRLQSVGADWEVDDPVCCMCAEAATEIKRLQRIIDSRPAINAGLPGTYIEWSRGIYQCDALQATGGHNA